MTDWTSLSFGAPLPPGGAVPARLRSQGFAVLDAAELGGLVGASAADCARLAPLWNDLPPDDYLKDGGHYRFRRHGSLIQGIDDGEPALRMVPYRPHWQPTSYNALHGGMLRHFAPLTEAITGASCWAALVEALGRQFAAVRPVARWYVEAHQFRIDTASGVGRPTPEGAHRDGVDFVAVVLVGRRGIRGGETRVFEIDGRRGVRFTLEEPWSALLMDDARVIHESTPVLPDDEQMPGWRDTLVLTYRADGFLDPPVDPSA